MPAPTYLARAFFYAAVLLCRFEFQTIKIDRADSIDPPILSCSIAPSTGQYQRPQQVTNRNTAAPLFDIVSVTNEAPLPADAIYPDTSSTDTSGPELKVASPPKELFIPRLLFVTSTDDALEYIPSVQA